MTVIASDETLDRHGEVIPIDSWMLEPFRAAPRMLLDHDHRVEKIAGKWDNVRIEGGKLLMEPQFHDFTPLAKAAKQMVEEGFLDTVSVGFIPHEVEDQMTHELKPMNELIEVSWVTVPANPSARVLKELGEKELSETEKAEVEKWLGAEKKEEKIVAVASVDAFKKETGESVLCERTFIEMLISDSEKLLKLTSGEGKSSKVVASDKVLQMALKEVARIVNHSLHKANQG